MRLSIDSQHQELITKIARKYTRGSSISWEDAAQTAIMKVYEAVNAGKFHHGGMAEFQRWATVVARYEIINFTRKERLRHHQSLDANIVGTDISLVETIPDEFNLWDSITRADLITKAKQAIILLDASYPTRGYLQLWEGRVQQKTLTQIGYELGISQGEASKRWQELVERVTIKLAQQNSAIADNRRRSDNTW